VDFTFAGLPRRRGRALRGLKRGLLVAAPHREVWHLARWAPRHVRAEARARRRAGRARRPLLLRQPRLQVGRLLSRLKQQLLLILLELLLLLKLKLLALPAQVSRLALIPGM
jgi:hypothetical protein